MDIKQLRHGNYVKYDHRYCVVSSVIAPDKLYLYHVKDAKRDVPIVAMLSKTRPIKFDLHLAQAFDFARVDKCYERMGISFEPGEDLLAVFDKVISSEVYLHDVQNIFYDIHRVDLISSVFKKHSP